MLSTNPDLWREGGLVLGSCHDKGMAVRAARLSEPLTSAFLWQGGGWARFGGAQHLSAIRAEKPDKE